MIKAVIFDIGGVVLKDKIESVFYAIADSLAIDRFAFETLVRHYLDDLLKGNIGVVDVAKIIEKKFGKKDVYSHWIEAYINVMKVDNSMLMLVKRLQKQYIVGAISNTMDAHSVINKNRGIYDYFNPLLLSCDLNIKKPDSDMFNILLSKTNLKSEECIFIDDRIEHLQTPRELGFNVIEYKNYEQLISELSALIQIV